MKSMGNDNKSPGNDGLTKEFELSVSQRQAIIKLIEKRTEIKDTLKIGDLFPC